MTDHSNTVLQWIEHAAAAGEQCPTNVDIATRLGVTKATASRIVSRLEQDGLVSVERNGTWRIVTVCATGARTAPPMTKRPIRADELAELIADGMGMVRAARTMGISYERARQIWRAIRDELGWQAQ